MLPAPTRDQQREMEFLRERLDQAADAMRAALPARSAAQEAWEQRIAAEGGGAPVPGAWQSLGPIPQDDFEQAFANDGGWRYSRESRARTRGSARNGPTAGCSIEGQTISPSGAPSGRRARRLPRQALQQRRHQVWLNGVEVHSNRSSTDPARKRRDRSTRLRRPTSLLKITNAGGAYAYSYESGYTGLPLELLEIARTPAASRTADQADQILAYYREHIAPELAPLRDDRAQLQARLDEINAAVPKIPVLRELPPGEQRATHIFEKGSFLSPGGEVFPGTPAFLHPLPYDAPRNRLGMARWLVDRENPLTARVFANRFWTGSPASALSKPPDWPAGRLPSNPLLDWPRRSAENGWSMGQLCRTIVTSATYRQSSAVQ